MTGGGGEQLTWRLQHGVNASYTRLLDDVRACCIASCATHLPGDSGYEVQRRRFDGPLEGFTLHVRRGPFRATVSVQQYASTAGRDQRTLRLVANARHIDELANTRPRGYRLARWSAASGAFATLGIAVVAVAVAGGGLSAWAASLLLIPMLFATRVCIAAWADSIMRDQQRSLNPAQSAKTLPPASDPRQRDLARWEHIRQELADLQHTLPHRLELRPFRGLGAGHTMGLSEPVPAKATSLAPAFSATT